MQVLLKAPGLKVCQAMLVARFGKKLYDVNIQPMISQRCNLAVKDLLLRHDVWPRGPYQSPNDDGNKAGGRSWFEAMHVPQTAVLHGGNVRGDSDY